MTTTPPKTERDLIEAFENIRTWKRRSIRAPHKPLLLLLALGRLQRGEQRLTSYLEIEPRLRYLLKTFGPTRKSYHPEYPFYHLQEDGLWEIPGVETLRRRRGNTNISATVLRDRGAVGGLPGPTHKLLIRRPTLRNRLARLLLEGHFPESLHADILRATGVDATELPVQRRTRDPAFRELVLVAYEYRCAICGLDPLLDGTSAGLEAAHVHWYSHGGPSGVDNGVCLCPLHHKALDLGFLGISPDHRVLLSKRLGGGEAVETFLLQFHGKALRAPQKGEPRIHERHLEWHRREVFKDPARVL